MKNEMLKVNNWVYVSKDAKRVSDLNDRLLWKKRSCGMMEESIPIKIEDCTELVVGDSWGSCLESKNLEYYAKDHVFSVYLNTSDNSMDNVEYLKNFMSYILVQTVDKERMIITNKGIKIHLGKSYSLGGIGEFEITLKEDSILSNALGRAEIGDIIHLDIKPIGWGVSELGLKVVGEPKYSSALMDMDGNMVLVGSTLKNVDIQAKLEWHEYVTVDKFLGETEYRAAQRLGLTSDKKNVSASDFMCENSLEVLKHRTIGEVIFSPIKYRSTYGDKEVNVIKTVVPNSCVGELRRVGIDIPLIEETEEFAASDIKGFGSSGLCKVIKLSAIEKNLVGIGVRDTNASTNICFDSIVLGRNIFEMDTNIGKVCNSGYTFRFKKVSVEDIAIVYMEDLFK